MFDQNVQSEGLGRAEVAFDKIRQRDMGAAPSPDGLGGLGAYVTPEQGDPYADPYALPSPPPQRMQPAYQQMQPAWASAGVPHQMEGEFAFLEPEDTSSNSAMKSSGFTLLFVALATGAGYAFKGGHGAVAGLLLSAGLANGYRAQKWFSSEDPGEKHEAIVSTVFAAGEIFGGLFVGYQAMKRAEKNRE